MVEHTMNLDSIFGSLADATRRDILLRVSRGELSVGEIARSYDLTLASISKHLKVLEKAKLVVKHRRGKEQIVQLAPKAFANANEYLRYYERLLNGRLDSLENYLRQEQ